MPVALGRCAYAGKIKKKNHLIAMSLSLFLRQFPQAF
jgi:hypothetical protein